jgi:hypothetical protein
MHGSGLNKKHESIPSSLYYSGEGQTQAFIEQQNLPQRAVDRWGVAAPRHCRTQCRRTLGIYEVQVLGAAIRALAIFVELWAISISAFFLLREVV